MTKQIIPALFGALALAACVESGNVSRSNIDPISLATAPPGAQPGTCWGKTVTPAVVETANRKVLLQPAQISTDGRVQAAPIYKTETQQLVIQPRRENWFQVPCDAQLTPEFISSLQRALEARGFFRGPITGVLDGRTKAAVRRYQQSEGFDSPTLSVAAAQKLGLIAVPRSAAG